MIPFSDEELLEPVKESLKVIMPMLEQDGGGMELLGIIKFLFIFSLLYH